MHAGRFYLKKKKANPASAMARKGGGCPCHYRTSQLECMSGLDPTSLSSQQLDVCICIPLLIKHLMLGR